MIYRNLWSVLYIAIVRQFQPWNCHPADDWVASDTKPIHNVYFGLINKSLSLMFNLSFTNCLPFYSSVVHLGSSLSLPVVAVRASNTTTWLGILPKGCIHWGHLNWGHLSLRLSSIEVVFHWGCLQFRSSNIEVISHWGTLLLRSSSIEVVFHWGHLQLRLSFFEAVFHWGHLPLR